MNDLKTYNSVELTPTAITKAENDYKFQKELTEDVLDKLEGDFDQSVINEIVLWKVNRYAKVDDSLLGLLNKIDKNSLELDEEMTRDILVALLNCSGIQLAMASTILRFKNPQVYQIVDQRVFRFIYGRTLQDELKKEKDQVKVYLEYLKKLKEVCKEKSIDFSKSDRVLYELDKEYNKDIKLKY